MKIFKSENFSFRIKKNTNGHVVFVYNAIDVGITIMAAGFFMASMQILMIAMMSCGIMDALNESFMHLPMLLLLLAFCGVLATALWAVAYGAKTAVCVQEVIFDCEHQRVSIQERIFRKTKRTEFPLMDISFSLHEISLPNKRPPKNGYALSIVADGNSWMIARNNLKEDVVSYSKQCRSHGIDVQVVDNINKPADFSENNDLFGQSQKTSDIIDNTHAAKVRIIRDAVVWSFLAVLSLSIAIFVVLAALSPRKIGNETGEIDFVGILMLPLIIALFCTKRAINSIRQAWNFCRPTK